jgi:hypothetical protein
MRKRRPGRAEGHGAAPAPEVPLALCAALLGFAFAGMAALTWQKWVDPFVDFGQQLEISREVSLGRVLYRDVTSFHGPLSPHLQAALFLLFGPSIRTIVAFNLLVVATLALVLFRLLEVVAGRFAATGATLFFLVVFAFGQYTPASTYNYVAPYTPEIVHGLLLGLLAVLFAARTARSGKALDASLAGLSAGLCFLTKAETFAAALGAAAAALGAVVFARRRRGEHWVGLAAAFKAGLLLPAAVAFLLFLTALSPGDALLAALGPWPAVLSGKAADLALYRWVAGTADVAGSLASVAAWLAFFAGSFGLAALWAHRIRPHEASIGFILVFGGVGLYLATTWQSPLWFEAARPLPVLLAAAVAWLLLRPGGYLRGGGVDAPGVTRLSLAVFAFLLLLKTPLAARVYHYGQFLSMPGALLIAAALLGPAANAVGGAGGNTRLFRVVAAGALGLFAAVALVRTIAMGATRTCAVAEGANAFFTGSRGCLLEEVRRDLVSRAKPGQTLAVLPEGGMLNFLTGLRKPTRFTTLMPTEVTVWGEDAITEEFRKHPPDWVVLVQKDTSEFGPRFFGRDYLAGLGAFVAEGYEPVARWGDEPFSDRGFGVKLLKRKSEYPRGGPPGTSS